MATFLVLAALMLAAALAFVLPTLLRGRDARYATLAIAVLLPVTAVLLYRQVGNPHALDADLRAPTIDQAIADLAAKLKQQPDDAEGWALLGHAYEATQRFADARDALGHAHELAANDPDISVAYAEALALASATRRIDGEPRALLEAVLKTAPDHERGLWLLGISDYQAKHYDDAIAAWRHLLAVVPKDSEIAPSVQQQIARAGAERDGRETDAGGKPQSAAAAAASPHLQIDVELDAKLKDQLAPGDVLFVYAKAASGPPMPLAILRLTAAQLPLSVTLTDDMGMTPALKLSQFPQVIVGARVSKSGDAIARSGDLQATTKPLPVTTSTPIKLTIDQIVR